MPSLPRTGYAEQCAAARPRAASPHHGGICVIPYRAPTRLRVQVRSGVHGTSVSGAGRPGRDRAVPGAPRSSSPGWPASRTAPAASGPPVRSGQYERHTAGDRAGGLTNRRARGTWTSSPPRRAEPRTVHGGSKRLLRTGANGVPSTRLAAVSGRFGRAVSGSFPVPVRAGMVGLSRGSSLSCGLTGQVRRWTSTWRRPGPRWFIASARATT